MITSLGSLLREVLAGRDAKLQSVGEKEFGNQSANYLEVEAIRFERSDPATRIECPPGASRTKGARRADPDSR